MNSFAKLLAGTAVLVSLHTAAIAADLVVGVSWSNFQGERWKTDEAAIKAALDKAGAKYISADAQSSAAKQLTDVESLISQGANALIILAQDSDAIGPAVEKAVAEGIPVVGYDRLIENQNAFYITFDNKEVGRLQAAEVFKVKPEGNYVFIKGSSSDPNADFLFAGQQEVLKAAIDGGKIKNVGEAYTDGWKPENAPDQQPAERDDEGRHVQESDDRTLQHADGAADENAGEKRDNPCRPMFETEKLRQDFRLHDPHDHAGKTEDRPDRQIDIAGDDDKHHAGCHDSHGRGLH